MNTLSSDARTHSTTSGAPLTTNEREFLRLAEALAEWPSLIARMLRDHGQVGICSGCTMPGGRNVIMAPCPLRSLAMHAQKIIRERLDQTHVLTKNSGS